MIVVPGAPAPGGRPGPALERRVRLAASLWREGRAPRVLISGAGEAEAGAALAVALGVAADAVVIEPRARTTRENALYTRDLVGGRWLVVTCDFHGWRCRRVFGRVNPDVAVVTAATRWSTFMRMALREAITLGIYAARGWL